MSTGLLLDGVFASEALDSSGEVLDIDGMDISDLEEGRALANYEHKGSDDANGQEIVGKIIYAKKIKKKSDCTNDREAMFWEKVQLPFIYGIVRLYDGAGHEGAKALAAIIRDSHANHEPIIVGFSIEGSTLDKKGNKLVKTIARKVALTVKPCNKTAISGLLLDPNAPEGFEKSPVKPDLLALVPHKKEAKKNDHLDKMYQKFGGGEMVYGPEVTKALTAGNYNAAPGTLTNGAALQVEDRTLKARLKAAYRDWDRVTPFKKFLKFRLPEVSDDFLNHYGDLVESHVLKVKKAQEVITDLKKNGKLFKGFQKTSPSEIVQDLLRRFESLSVEVRKHEREHSLMKAVAPVVRKPAPKAAPPPQEEAKTVKYNNKNVKPGLMVVRTPKEYKQMSILSATPKEFHVVPQDKLSGWDEGDMLRIPRGSDKVNYQVLEHPQDLQESQVVDSHKHGVENYIKHDDIHDLVHGLDFAAPRIGASAGSRYKDSFWTKNAKGKEVYVKADPKEQSDQFGEPHMEAAYHNVARDFFGMGKYLPRVGAVYHPQTGRAHAVIEHVPGSHYESADPEHRAVVKHLGENGELDKMAVMNMVMGNIDRNWGNWMIDPKHGMKLIDHNVVLDPGVQDSEIPNYWHAYGDVNPGHHDEPLHPSAKDWAMKLDPNKLEAQLKHHGVPENSIHAAKSRLKNLQEILTKNPNASKIEAWVHPQVTSSGNE